MCHTKGSVLAGQHDIQDHELDPGHLQCVPHEPYPHRRRSQIAVFLRIVLEQAADLPIIVHNQNSLGLAHAGICARRGKDVTSKIVTVCYSPGPRYLVLQKRVLRK